MRHVSRPALIVLVLSAFSAPALAGQPSYHRPPPPGHVPGPPPVPARPNPAPGVYVPPAPPPAPPPTAMRPPPPPPVVVPFYPYYPPYPLLYREPEYRQPTAEAQPRVIVVERETVYPEWRRRAWAERSQPYAPPAIHIIGDGPTRHMRGPVHVVHGVKPHRRLDTDPQVIWLKEPRQARRIVKAGS